MLFAVRYVLPAVLVLAGIAVMVFDPTGRRWDGFSMLVGAGLSVLLFNVLSRESFSGTSDRVKEEEARDHFSRTGRWPDEEP